MDHANGLALLIGQLLLRQGLTLAVAESCTGGLLAAYVTSVPGSSAYFEGGAVTYSNLSKKKILAVPSEMLRYEGAVSSGTATAMAERARKLFHADVALAVTGVAGPGGGTPEKPVGLVYIALATSDAKTCREFLWAGSRRRNRHNSVRAALEMLRDHLSE